jgi:hypothetical protein
MKSAVLPSLLIFISCTNPFQNPVNADAITQAAPAEFVCNYKRQKENAKKAKGLINISEREKYLTGIIVDSLIPCWYGTPWDFNGTTEIPGSGKIACGYFVTTVLRDAGLPVQRIKMAQCASEEMIKALCRRETISRYSQAPVNDFIAGIKNSGKGIYITGLDNHTGFIYYDGIEVYFIHASYIGPKCVVKEAAAASSILALSKYRVKGKLKI